MPIRRKTTTTITTEERYDDELLTSETASNLTGTSIRHAETGNSPKENEEHNNDTVVAENKAIGRTYADFFTEQINNPPVIVTGIFIIAFIFLPKSFSYLGILYPLVVGSILSCIFFLPKLFSYCSKKMKKRRT